MTIRGFRQGRVAHLAAVVTAALLATAGMPAWAAPATSAKPATALEVQSEPAGAAVYVDGQLKGATPVAVEGIAAGDHTVRVVKVGFLENSRVVSVPASGRSVNVALTSTGVQPRAARLMQVEPGESTGGGGGGGKKWLFIGLGAAVLTGGVVAAIALAGKNDPPKVSGVTASPDVALQAATSVTFTASASDPDGDALTYTWNFGDGTTGSGASASHVYQTAGSYSVSVEVSDGSNKVTSSTSVTVVSLSGVWVGRFAGGYTITFSLAQNGAQISGSSNDVNPHNGVGVVSGSVTPQRSVQFQDAVGSFRPTVWTGTLGADGQRITGTVSGYAEGTLSFTLTR